MDSFEIFSQNATVQPENLDEIWIRADKYLVEGRNTNLKMPVVTPFQRVFFKKMKAQSKEISDALYYNKALKKNNKTGAKT